MKKLFLILSVIASSHCFSQSLLSLSRLSFGLKAGVNYSNYTHTDFATDALVGFHAGALVRYKITDNFSFQEEFLFSSQGARIKDQLFTKENVNVYYITVPFLLRYKTNFGLYVEAGPQTGLSVKDDNTTSGNFAKKLDLAMTGGIGYQTKSGFGIGVRYVAGLSKVGDFDIQNVKPDFKTSVAQASIFYIF